MRKPLRSSLLSSKMEFSTKNMDKISYLLNHGNESLIKDLFETNNELFFNDGQLAKLLLEIGANVPMHDFNTYLTSVKVDVNKMNSLQSWIWTMPSSENYIKKVVNTFPESKRDFYHNLSNPSFFNKLSSNNLLRDKAEVWAILENFKSNNPSLRSKSTGGSFKNEVLSGGSGGNKTAPNTPVRCDGTIDEVVLRLFSSQPKLFNNNFKLLRELTGLDPASFDFIMSLFKNRLTGKSQAGIDFISTYPTCNYSGEIYALLEDLAKVRPCYEEKSVLITSWVDVKRNFKEVVPSLLKINGGYFDNRYNLDRFRLVKSQKANDIFSLRSKNGVTNQSDVEWWKDFNQLCVDLKFLTACKKQWAILSDEQKQVLGSVSLGKNHTLEDFMTHDISNICSNLEDVLQEVCDGAPFDKGYLLDHIWCYSEYSNLLEEKNIILKNELNAINDFSKLLDVLIKSKSESAKDRMKIKYHIMNYVYDKGLIQLCLGSAYTYFVASVSGGS